MRTRVVRALRVVVVAGLLVAGVVAVGRRPDGWAGVLERFNLAAGDAALIEASGFIEAETAHVAAEVGGRIVEVAVAEGDPVDQGDLVAAVDGSALEARLDQARAALRAAEARRRGAREMLDLIEDQVAALPDGVESPELEAREARARTELRAARAQVDQARASVAAAEVQVEATRIRAPIDGQVGEVPVGVGEVVTPGQVVATIVRPDPVELVIFVPAPDIGGVRVGQPVEVTGDAYPGRRFQGSVAHIGSEAEFTPRNVQSPEERANLVFEVRVEVPNPRGDLRPGMPADATLRRSGPGGSR